MPRFFVTGRYANVTSTMALVIALGGTSYAAATLPRNSVGTPQIKRNAVGSAQIKSNAIGSVKIRDGSLLARDFAPGQLPTAQVGAAGTQGPRGQIGPMGPTGPTGAAGAAGAQGQKGETGAVGPTGPRGADGAAGDDGPAGAQGPQGPQGPAGPKGDTGAQGAPGAQGPKGDPGPPGDGSGEARPGDTLSGQIAERFYPNPEGFSLAAGSFPRPLPASVGAPELRFLINGQTSAECPGIGESSPGLLCVYGYNQENIQILELSADAGNEHRRYGFELDIFMSESGQGGWLIASWAYEVPDGAAS